MGLTVNLFLMATDVCLTTAQLFLSRHVRTSGDAISCSPRWLTQMIASPAYSSSVICPSNTYTCLRARTHTHNSSSLAPLSSEKKAAFHVEMNAFTLHFPFFFFLFSCVKVEFGRQLVYQSDYRTIISHQTDTHTHTHLGGCDRRALVMWQSLESERAAWLAAQLQLIPWLILMAADL